MLEKGSIMGFLESLQGMQRIMCGFGVGSVLQGMLFVVVLASNAAYGRIRFLQPRGA